MNIEYIDVLSLNNKLKTSNIKQNASISDCKPGKKNMSLVIMVVEFKNCIKLKNDQTIYSYIVSDITGSIICNFYDDIGKKIRLGDVLYMTSCYSTVYNKILTLYSPKLNNGNVLKIDEYNLAFNLQPNLSLKIYDDLEIKFNQNSNHHNTHNNLNIHNKHNDHNSQSNSYV